MKKCLNCGVKSVGKYCQNCGQEIELKRLEVKTIFHDVTHGILHWENSILKTFRYLLLKPGGTVKDYISGLRKSYVKPFSYFIFIQTVFVILFHRLGEKYFAFASYSIQDTGDNPGKTEQIQHLISNYLNYCNYFMPVFLALYLYLFFRKKTGINYAESIAASFYWVGTTLVFSIVLMILSLIDVRIWSAGIFINSIFLIFAIIKFTNLKNFKGFLKSILTVYLSYITYGLFVGLVLLLYMQIFMK